ncbi:cilia- and flagella-associated protein 299 isoform X2 [Ambystoma mexicanum]|uniref:cilia- and flagella-associated protein 299 isoform X2 n=1 Tax=Ambystoma mexicanum TaxID=8296 RepID=UPI0037E73E99
MPTSCQPCLLGAGNGRGKHRRPAGNPSAPWNASNYGRSGCRCSTNTRILASAGKELKDNFHIALAEREEANRSGKLSSIIFIRDRSARNQELSGYIDYANRLKNEDFEPYFSGKKKLMPRPNDLSFYNWETHVSTSNASPNYQVIAENASGLLFKNKRDRKIINVDPKASPGDNTTRTPIQTDLYIQVVIYDHVTRRKT